MEMSELCQTGTRMELETDMLNDIRGEGTEDQSAVRESICSLGSFYCVQAADTSQPCDLG